VLDGEKLIREYWAKQPKPIPVAEALALKNTSPSINSKILSSVGRPPANDSDVNYEATIERHISGDVKSTSPILISSTSEFDVLGLTGSGLFGFDWNLAPFASADTVVSWETSKDKMYDKVVMRKDLTWSDGKPMTAHDVAFSFRTIMNPKIPIPAVRSGTNELRWVEAYDDYTVVFFHKQALATNIWNVNFPILPRHVYEDSIAEDVTLVNSKHHVKFENNPVCSGPYVITTRRRGQEIVLERREGYYMFEGKQVRNKPYFKRIRFSVIEDGNTALLALKSGKLDEMILTPEQWTSQTGGSDFYKHNTKATGQEYTYFYFGWNNESDYFSDKKTREAMSYAFDHDEMLKTMYHGLYEPCQGIFHPASWMFPKKPGKIYKQDLEKAYELLQEAGWEDTDNDGVLDKVVDGKRIPFQFTILTANKPDRVKLCNLLKVNLDQLGIRCTVRPVEFTTLQELMGKRKFDAYFGGWGSGADPDTSENVWTTDAIKTGRNYLSYSHPKVDQLFLDGKAEYDREKRAAIYAKIHEQIYNDHPCTFLYYQSSFYGFNKNLRGYMFSPRGPYNYSPGFNSIWSATK
ncbi:MAG: peptide-binding protein, partial [Planctomycetota bacterium]|nr:peptide-binding protein [Planctomycetota bacterium]